MLLLHKDNGQFVSSAALGAFPLPKATQAKELRSHEGGWVRNTLILVQLPVAMGREARQLCRTKGHDASLADWASASRG